MPLHGKQIVAGEAGARGTDTFTAINPSISTALPTRFHEATADEVDRAFVEADRAFHTYRLLPRAEIASFLELIAAEVESLGDELAATAHAESGLPLSRLENERMRMLSGIRMFAAL